MLHPAFGEHQAGGSRNWQCLNVHKAAIQFWDPVSLQLPTAAFRSNPVWVQTRFLLPSNIINCTYEQLIKIILPFCKATYPECRRFGSWGWCPQTLPASPLHAAPKSSWCSPGAPSETLPESKHHHMQPVHPFLSTSSWFQCTSWQRCFCTTISNRSPSLLQCVSHLHSEVPRVQDLQDISRLSMIWHQLISSLASHHSHLWERENIYWLLSWEQSLWNTGTAQDSPSQQSPNGGHLHSDLHRRTRHEDLPPTDRTVEVKKDIFTKRNHRKDTSAWEHPFCFSTFPYFKPEDTQHDCQAVLFFQA